MTRQISDYGLSKITQWEGCVLHAYDDFDPTHRMVPVGGKVRGTLTLGVGHTGPDVKPGMTITQAEADRLLRADLEQSEAVVESSVSVSLNENQFAALVSFAFNVGAAAFRGSTLVKKLNAGDYAAVPLELMKWTKSKGKNMPGLVNRRTQEAAVWGRDNYVASNTVDAAPATPKWVTPESVGTVVASGTGVIAVANGSGPVQYALAAAIVIGVCIAAFFFIRSRVAAR